MAEQTSFNAMRRQRQFPEKKLAVLREAAIVFAERGVAQTSLDDIAERLQVSKPAVYYYVKSKDDIISECLALAHQDDEDNIERISGMPVSGLEKVRELMLYYGRAITEDVFGRFLATVDLHALSAPVLAKHRESQRYLFESSRRLILEGIADGSVRACDPTTVTFAFVGALNSVIHWYDPNGPRSAESVVSEIWELIRSGLASK